jgi:serine/threonine protein phosphatase PrpC
MSAKIGTPPLTYSASSMPQKIIAAHHTQTGTRECNEDAASVHLPTGRVLARKGMMAIMADGVSGQQGHRDAAADAVRQLQQAYYATPDDEPVPQVLERLIQTINQNLQATARATTLTTLVIRGPHYHCAHVGDSRLYRLRDNTLMQLTRDHAAHGPGLRHVLTRTLGRDPHVAIDHHAGAVHVGDVFLLVTDGAWGVLPDDELAWHIAELAERKRSAEATAKLVVDAAIAAESQDNISALVVRVDDIDMTLTETQPPDAHAQDAAPPCPARDPLSFWKIVGMIALILNLLLFLLLITGTQK